MSIFNCESSESLSVGSLAPRVTALNQEGDVISFADIYAEGITLVYFYPMASTPGCTAEACSLRDAAQGELSSLRDSQGNKIQILGVSKDSPKAQKKFHKKLKLPFALIPDEEKKVAKAFGVKINPLGMFARESFLIQNGKIVWFVLKAQTKNAAIEIQKALDTLHPMR